MQWYYLVQGQRQGPVDDAGLETLVRQGVVLDDTLVWREGLTEWHPYGTVKPPPAPAPPSRPEPVQTRPEPIQTRPEPASLPHPSSTSGPAGYAAPPPARKGSAHGKFFFFPVLDALNDGQVIRKSVVVCLKVAAVLVALGGLLTALTILTSAFHGSGGAALGGILFAILMVGTAACVGQIYWYRAASVAALEHSRNTVIPIFAILSRAGGEAVATGFAGIGVGACLFLWLSPEGAPSVLQGVPFLAQVPAEGGFLAGLLVLVYLAALGFAALILGYLWAECLMLLVDIERNTRTSAR
jgi:hypothetical protein